MYCMLFRKYIDNHECNVCDSRSGYERGTWEDTCIQNRTPHHPILNDVRWWLKIDSFKFKLYICVAKIANLFKPHRRWFVHSDRRGLHVGNLNYLCMFIGEPR